MLEENKRLILDRPTTYIIIRDVLAKLITDVQVGPYPPLYTCPSFPHLSSALASESDCTWPATLTQRCFPASGARRHVL